jgi:hypothetical protein
LINRNGESRRGRKNSGLIMNGWYSASQEIVFATRNYFGYHRRAVVC